MEKQYTESMELEFSSNYDTFFLVLKNLNYDNKMRSEQGKTIENIQIQDNDYQGTTKKTTEKIIEILKENPNISVKEMAEIVGLTTDGVQYHIRNLKAHGVIERVGPDKGGYWQVK